MSDMVVKNKRPFGFYVCSVAVTYLAPIIGGYISDRFIGAFIGTTAVGILVASTFAQGEVQGFRAAFQLCAVICVVDLIWFLFGSKSLSEDGNKPFKLGKEAEKDVVVENKPLTKSEKKKVFAIILISTFSVIFWVFWYLTYLAAYDYGAAFINMNVSGFNVPLSWFDSLNSMTCIALGPVLGMLWFKLSKTARGDLSLFKKLGIGNDSHEIIATIAI